MVDISRRTADLPLLEFRNNLVEEIVAFADILKIPVGSVLLGHPPFVVGVFRREGRLISKLVICMGIPAKVTVTISAM